MYKENQEAYAVIKGTMPKVLKFRFKALCAQYGLKMSEVLQVLISEWVQADGPTSSFMTDTLDENRDNITDVKAYIPSFLKTRFKVLCAQREVMQRFILYNLIREWVERTHESNLP
ncbi:hypothetical protein VF14_22870 [Nostoc linckia z18]|uniref:Uncharacterized protein n=3 Tax=Nostoc TaxID=1177 RepID=A0A9Q5Z9Q2_NOSLI|nr:hypothetical protein [Nostoc sp. 2RC]PHJ56981.1 hypothetical protein VF02_31525 [Nostoc linckia z1]PHJ63036.1 hypothetical protein VF03_30775 [Nostoc linckia z2]PHJ70889.1 hypothetical protein VF05_08785 [Nostoc linckia z3]PHJ75642.1 hypothetical protein VF06_32905 [Nostoc linckia z4]PHJ87553.1 hypothetical protein VF07_19435 [Nostoc linckia z6]PHJ93646.1 hypothetical protein VF04_25205 [Nostoc linckia z7]PHK01526.1 hypothetical protein VF08_21950 [Nostoc linckia z8]PHK08166.1 hypothetic